ncbi:MAG: hypothetical protein C4336_00645 [Armatimonadota bacterium]
MHRLEQKTASEHTEQLRYHSRLFEEVLEALRDLRRIAEEHTQQLKEHSHQFEEIQREQKKMQDTLGMLKGSV